MARPNQDAVTVRDQQLRQTVKAVIFGRMALITLVAAMAVAFSDTALSLARHYPFGFLLALSAGLAVAYHRAARSGAEVRVLLTVQLLVDVAVISYLLLFTGGASSQFAPLYLLAPLMGGVFLSARGGILFAAAAALSYVLFYVAERGGVMPETTFGLMERLSESALRLRLILYVPLLFVVGAIGGGIGRSLREGQRALNEVRAELNRALFDTEIILENLSGGLATVDADGVIQHWNRAASEIFGLPAAVVRGRHYLSVFGPGHAEFRERLRIALETGAAGTRDEAALELADGRKVPLGISTSLLPDASGERRSVIALFQDLSEVKSLEERMRRGETLAAIGELSAGIAHEIRNCLNPISGSVEVLQRELHVQGENGRLLALIVRESERLDKFIREFLDYAREKPLQTEPILVSALVSESAELVRRHASVRPGKQISLSLPDEPVWVKIDQEQIKQVLMNLLINALEAIDGNGVVTMRVRGSDADKSVPWGTPPSARALIEVQDTGSGIPPENLARVLEPFFSTKQGGTGLGLAIATRIVERHGGILEVDSQVGFGTTICLWLPRMESPVDTVAHAA